MSMLALGLGTFTTTLALVVYDYFQQKKFKGKNEKEKKTKGKSVKLLLTGGPCGGKSEGINCIYHSFKKLSAPFFIVPEAATIIGSAGLTLDLSQFKPRQIELFQIYLMRLQYNLEDAITSVASILQKFEKVPVILCDRGLLDGKAYAGDENWAKMLTQINITEEEILDRYAAAIHMVTAAKGAENYYNYSDEEIKAENLDGELEGGRVRKEDPQTAKSLDQKIQKCYKNHPNRFVISNQFFVKSFDDKKTVLLAQVYQILSQIIKSGNLSEYYNDYESSFRKNSDENIQNLNSNPSAYLVRKRKCQKFIRKNTLAMEELSSPRKKK